ncbi:MAG: V-type ATPase 116kDa subunit family protein [Candidatus Thorarchaeota archaeon]
MRLSITPTGMLVAKIVSHRDYEREILRSLEEFGLFEFVDVRLQTGTTDVKKTPEEEMVYSLLGRVTSMITSLGLDTTRSMGPRVGVDDTRLNNVLTMVNDVIGIVEPQLLEIDKNIAVATLDLDRQHGLRDVAKSVGPLRLDLGLLGESEYTYTVAGVIGAEKVSKLEWAVREVSEGSYAIRRVPVSRNRVAVALSVPIERKDAVDRVFTAIGFEQFKVPEGQRGQPDEIVRTATAEISRIGTELKRLRARKRFIAKEWGSKILAAWECLNIEKSRIDSRRFIVYTSQAMKIWGWIPEGTEERLKTILKERVGPVIEVTFEHPEFAEYEAPTHLDNPRVMAAAEGLVKAYGVPSRHDIDPTKIMFFSFPLIFGLIFADVGQGLLILLIGLAANISVRRRQNWGPIMGYVQTGAIGLMMMGLFAIFGGLLFGSFFGSETVIEPLWPIFSHTTETGLRNPFRDAHMLKLSIEIGIIQMTMGIILNLYVRLKHRQYRDAIVAVSYLWLYLSFVTLVFGVSYSNISAWFSTTGSVYLWVPILGIGHGTGNNGVYPQLPVSPLVLLISSIIVPLVLMLVASVKGGMDGIVHFIEYLIGMVSHTVSYARIFALNMVHVVLSSVFFMVVPAIVNITIPPVEILGIEIVPHSVWHEGHQVPPFLPLGGAVVGSLIVGILEGLLAFMHTLRLHFVEWFSKFFHAGGIPFRPHLVMRLHTVAALSSPVAVFPQARSP